MATLIDSLIVSLNLDPSGYLKNAATARAAQKTMTAEEAKAAKDSEDFAKKRSEAYRKIGAEVLGLLAVFTAGKGVKEFVASITSGDAATGRLARSLDMSVKTLSTWEGMAERTGGSAEGIAASFQGLMGDLQNFALTGQSSTIPYFRALGISVADSSGKIRPLEDIFLDLNKAVQGMDPARATAMLRGLHIDQNTISMLLMTPDALRKLRDETAKGAAISDVTPKRRSGAKMLLRNSGSPVTSDPRSAAPGTYKPILDLLGKSEGTDKGRGYNETLGYGKHTGGNVKLTGMTLDQVAEVQKKMLVNGAPSTAVGRYQFIQGTLKDLAGQLGMNPSTTKFDQETQDRLAERDVVNRGGDKFRAGLMSFHDFMRGLSKEWASLADPDTGKSFYGQGTGASTERLASTLRQLVPSNGDRYASNDNRTVNNHHSETHINGPIAVHTQATDAKGIADDMHFALRGSFATQANTGLA